MDATNIPTTIAGYNIVERFVVVLYQIDMRHRLGTGSFATVYRGISTVATSNGIRATVAIKCIDLRSVSSSRISSNCVVSEIGILKQLKHRHIVQMIDFQWDKSNIYIMMEYCGGGSLSSFIRLHQCLIERVARKFFQQLASAIHYLRSFNIAHMDLKPQNILLTNRYRPILKVADFGLSQYLQDGSNARSFRGSPLYIAPEMYTRQKYDARVDLWSCGGMLISFVTNNVSLVILYECLYGAPPFVADSVQGLIDQITSHESIKLPSTVVLSDSCIDLLKGLLVRNPDNRFSFNDFFTHPFVDVVRAPSEISLDKADSLVEKADNAQLRNDNVNAVKYLIEAIEMYLSAMQVIEDDSERSKLRNRVHEYLHRAELLKHGLRPSGGASSLSTASVIDSVQQQWSDTPQVQAACIVISRAVELEHNEQWEEAIVKYKLAIESMLQLLSRCSPSLRKQRLQAIVQQWLVRAEQLQQFIDVNRLRLSQVVESEQLEKAIEDDTAQLANQCSIQ